MNKSINILGMGEGLSLAPAANCWGATSVILSRNVDLAFEMHLLNDMKPGMQELRTKIINAAIDKQTWVYSCEAIAGTTYIRYPIEQIVGYFKTAFFSNTICYMIALAIFWGYKEINLYGVEHGLTHGGEYVFEKPGVDYWKGRAEGMGIAVNVNGELSEVGKTYNHMVYGYMMEQSEFFKKYGEGV